MNSILQFDNNLYPDANNNSNNNINNSLKDASKCDKYSLRPRSLRRCASSQKHIDEEKIKPIPSTSPKTRVSKPKKKPQPLSKYRRKNANARERCRMREINAAFEALRRAVPHLQNLGPASVSTNEKLTKITTLRLAMKYISALSAALKDTATSAMIPDFGDLLSDCSDLDCLFLESDGESLQLHSDLSDHSLTPADFNTEFTDSSPVSVEFAEQFSPTFPDQSLSPFDTLFYDFS